MRECFLCCVLKVNPTQIERVNKLHWQNHEQWPFGIDLYWSAVSLNKHSAVTHTFFKLMNSRAFSSLLCCGLSYSRAALSLQYIGGLYSWKQMLIDFPFWIRFPQTGWLSGERVNMHKCKFQEAGTRNQKQSQFRVLIPEITFTTKPLTLTGLRRNRLYIQFFEACYFQLLLNTRRSLCLRWAKGDVVLKKHLCKQQRRVLTDIFNSLSDGVLSKSLNVSVSSFKNHVLFYTKFHPF